MFSSVLKSIIRMRAWAQPSLVAKFHATPVCLKSWKLGKLNHVAIAVPHMEQAASFYKDILGATVSDPQPQVEHGVTTVFVELGDTKIELLHPLGLKSPIAGFLEKHPSGGMHHICMEWYPSWRSGGAASRAGRVSSAGVRAGGSQRDPGERGRPYHTASTEGNPCTSMVQTDEHSQRLKALQR